MSLTNLRQNVRLLEEMGLAELDLIRRQRPYKIPKGYMDWRYISGAIAYGMYCANYQRDRDSVIKCWGLLGQLWYDEMAPTYCLDAGLLKELRQTEILGQKHLLRDLSINLGCFLLVLPDNAIKTGNGANLSYCIVNTINPDYIKGVIERYQIKESTRSQILTERPNLYTQVSWSSVDDSGCTWYSAKGIDKDGEIFGRGYDMGRNEITDGDRQFLADVENLVFNVLLLLSYEPEIITEYRERVKGFNPRQPQNKERYWYPRWLAEPPVMKVRYVYCGSPQTNSDGTKRASPHPHLRKAHWKRVPIGPGKCERKWVRIRSTDVRPNRLNKTTEQDNLKPLQGMR